MAGLQQLSDEDLLRAIGRSGRTAPEAPALNWEDVPGQALANAPASGWRFLENTAYPFLHPIETAQSFYDVGKGLVAKTGAIDDPEAEAKVEAIGQFFADRYGSIDNLKRTLAEDPVGVAADAAAVLSGGAALGARAPGMVGATARAVGKVGSAIDPVSIGVKGAELTGKVASYPLGLTTGVAPKTIRDANKAGQQGNTVFTDHMRGRADINGPVEMARRGVKTLADRRSKQYTRDMASVKASQAPIDMKPINNAYLKLVHEVAPSGFVKSESAIKTLDSIQAKLREFTGLPRTPETVDWLKQSIGDIRDHTPFGTQERRVADAMYNEVKGAIVKQAPEYSKAMEGYSRASEQLGELTKTFSLGEKASKDTTLRRLQSITRDNVNTNFGSRQKLGNELAKVEPDLAPALAGQSMNTVLPRGLSRAVAAGGGAAAVSAVISGGISPWLLPAGVLASPRIVGEGAYLAGRADRALRPAGAGAQQAGRLAGDAMIPLRAGASATPIETLSDEELMERLNGATR